MGEIVEYPFTDTKMSGSVRARNSGGRWTVDGSCTLDRIPATAVILGTCVLHYC